MTSTTKILDAAIASNYGDNKNIKTRRQAAKKYADGWGVPQSSVLRWDSKDTKIKDKAVTKKINDLNYRLANKERKAKYNVPLSSQVKKIKAVQKESGFIDITDNLQSGWIILPDDGNLTLDLLLGSNPPPNIRPANKTTQTKIKFYGRRDDGTEPEVYLNSQSDNDSIIDSLEQWVSIFNLKNTEERYKTVAIEIISARSFWAVGNIFKSIPLVVV